MSKLIYRLVTVLLLSATSLYQAAAMDVALESYSYYDPATGNNYVETYLRVHGPSVKFIAKEAGLQRAAVNFTITIEQGQSIVAFEKYTLSSPAVQQPTDFIDVKRFGLSAGKYYVHVIAEDANDATNTIELKKLIEVAEPSEQLLSDVMVLGNVRAANAGEHNSFVKQGVYMEPLSFGFLHDTVARMPIYVESYDAPAGAYIRYSLFEMHANTEKPFIAKYKKLSEDKVQALLLYLPLDKVISGNYEARVELYDANKQLLSISATAVSRSNKVYDKAYWESYNETITSASFVDSVETEDLRYDLLSLIPVAKEPLLSMLGTVIDIRNEAAQRQFLFRYWKEHSPDYPDVAYRSYRKVADLVHEMYDNNVGFGFQTDRGHIFLKYGKPNKMISIDTEPDAPPYEIWYYSKIDGGTSRQTDVRFIFYNPSLAANDYQLLHSTCIGERNNPAWEVELYRNASPESQIGSTIEATEVEDGWNRRAKEYFNDF